MSDRFILGFGAALLIQAPIALLLACAHDPIPAVEYKAQLEVCIDQGKRHQWTRAQVDQCIAHVRAEWDEAGAPSASEEGGE